MAIRVRTLTDEERRTLNTLAHSRTAPTREVERAKIIWLAAQGLRGPAIAQRLGIHEQTVRDWLKRFNAHGLPGLNDLPRPGKPALYTPEQRSEVIATALRNPRELDLPFASWTLDRLQIYLQEHKGIGIKRSRIDDLLLAEGLRWRTQETWFSEKAKIDAQQAKPEPPQDPEFAQKKGAIESLYLAPPEGSLVVCLDQMGPLSARSYPGTQLVRAQPVSPEQPAERAKQEVDYGRRGKGYFFGAFCPATGAALTRAYDGRTIANWVDFLERTDLWLPQEGEGVTRVYAILDNLNVHRATDVLLFSLAHPRWEFVFTPKYAAYLNLIEPWWKVLRSLALKGRRFETWEEVVTAVEKATTYWNAHRHPFRWGQRRRHRPKRKPGWAAVPKTAQIPKGLAG